MRCGAEPLLAPLPERERDVTLTRTPSAPSWSKNAAPARNSVLGACARRPAVGRTDFLQKLAGNWGPSVIAPLYFDLLMVFLDTRS